VDRTQRAPQANAQPTNRQFFWRNSPLFPPPEQRRQPYAFYARMRRDEPVARDDRNNLWAVYRYDDVKRVLTDFQTFSSDRSKLDHPAFTESERPFQRSSLISLDPPRHKQLRDLVSRAFTPRAIASLEPRIDQIADALLDRTLQSPTFDLVRDFSDPLPVIVIAEMLGIPTQDRATFKRWSDALIGESDGYSDGDSEEEMARRRDAIDDMDRYFCQVIAERRLQPRDDLVTRLVQAEIDGQRLSDDELLSFCTLLLVAGNVTTTNLLGSAVLCFLEHRDQYDRLRSDPPLVPTAIEEVLRFEPPAQAILRITTTEVSLGDCSVNAGAMVVGFIGSANRDESIFANPDAFEVTRAPNPHLSFGAGIHFCLGAPLARLESRVALRRLLDRASDLELADPGAVEYTKGFLHGVTRLPLRALPARSGRGDCRGQSGASRAA
jgi:cytochrome P450